MNHLNITSNKETIEEVENFFKSDVLSTNRNMKLAGTRHESGYSSALIVPAIEDTRIPAEDLFWLGFHSGIASGKKENQPEEIPAKEKLFRCLEDAISFLHNPSDLSQVEIHVGKAQISERKTGLVTLTVNTDLSTTGMAPASFSRIPTLNF